MPNYILQFHPLAQEEVKEAYLYYQDKQLGLGDRLLDSLDHLFDLILGNPQLFAKDFQEIRKGPLEKFPFTIYYEISGNEIFVYSVFHQRRNPDAWKRRTQ